MSRLSAKGMTMKARRAEAKVIMGARMKRRRFFLRWAG